MQIGDVRFLCRFSSLTPNEFFHLLLRFENDFVDSRRMNPAVLNQLDHRLLGRFAADTIECRHDNNSRSVIDDHIDPRRFFEGSNISPLTADDSPLHFVVRNINRRDRRFRGMRGGVFLNRHSDNFASQLLGLLLEFRFVLQDQAARLVLQFAFELIHQHGCRRLLVESADLEQLLLFLLDDFLKLFFARVDNLGSFRQFQLSRFEHSFFLRDVVLLILQSRFPLIQLSFLVSNLITERIEFLFDFFTSSKAFFLSRQLCVAAKILAVAPGGFYNFITRLIRGTSN